MGFWTWLTGKPKAVEEVAVVWMNDEARVQGLCKEVDGQLLANPVVLVVAHFPTSLERWRQEFEQRNLSVIQQRRLLPADLARALSGAGDRRILLVPADALVPDDFPGPTDDDAAPLTILVVERHLLRSKDDRIAAFARSLGRRCQLRFHASLQDPLMQIFAGEWVRNVLSNLGQKESEPIESGMVSRRIQAAQNSLAKRVTNEQQADSAEEWLKLNVPG